MSLGRTSPPLSVDKSLALLVQVLEGDFASISALESAAGLPLSTAHRLLTGRQHAGFIVAVSRGRYISGTTLLPLARPGNDTNKITVQNPTPVLDKLPRRHCPDFP